MQGRGRVRRERQRFGTGEGERNVRREKRSELMPGQHQPRGTTGDIEANAHIPATLAAKVVGGSERQLKGFAL